MKIGITFSHPHLEYLHLDVKEALHKAFSLHFFRLRLAAYWSRIEKKEGYYSFSEIHRLLEQCEKKGQKVVMVVGVKAPRWPEFYWPEFIKKDISDLRAQESILNFVGKTIREIGSYKCITHWQVENEPLDPSGPEDKTVGISLLKKEVHLVRSLDKRPILLNLWGNDLLSRGLFPQVERLADVIGLELYYKQYMRSIFGKPVYAGPRQSHEKLKSFLKKSSKPIWITELQAEPWEKDEAGYLSANPGSMSPEQMENNMKKVLDLAIEETHLWGFEYWLFRSKQGDNGYLKAVERFTHEE